LKIFTYWEGQPNIIAVTCVKSISRVFGSDHLHLTPETLRSFITLPRNILETPHLGFRTDYIRAALLLKYGGWWFDSDIFLLANPSKTINLSHPALWTENKKDIFGRPNICNAVLYSPANSPYLNKVIENFTAVKTIPTLWTAGQEIFSKVAYDATNFNIQIFDHSYFYPILPEYWPDIWAASHNETKLKYGIHMYLSKIQRKKHAPKLAEQITEIGTLNNLLDLFPKSLFTLVYKSTSLFEKA